MAAMTAPNSNSGNSGMEDLAAAPDAFARQILAVVVSVSIFVAICVILWRRGLRVVISTSTFIASLVVTQLMMKRLSSPPLGYRFPSSVTTLHFATVWLVCVVYWAWAGDLRKCSPASLGSAKRYFMYVVPIASSLPLSVIFNNQAMVFVGAGLNAIVGTLTPVTTALLSNVLGRKIAKLAWVGVLIACGGALVITMGELSHAKASGSASQAPLWGLVLSSLAVLLRSLKVVLQDMLLNSTAYQAECGPGSDKGQSQGLPPMHVWALQGPPCLAIAAIYALVTEDQGEAWRQLTPAVGLTILCTCVSAAFLNILGMIAIKDLGASSMQIVGKLNTIIIVALSMGFLGERMPIQAFVGTGVVLVGVAVFERAQAQASQASSGLPKV